MMTSLLTKASTVSSRYFGRDIASKGTTKNKNPFGSTTITEAIRPFNSIVPGVVSGRNSANRKSTTTLSDVYMSESHGAGMAESFSTTATPSSTVVVMTRREIVKEVAEAHDLTLAKSERIVATVLDTIVEGVSDGKSVKLSKFGAFEKSTSAARTARNPKTGESVKVPSKQRIRFRPSKHFKDTVQ